MKRSLLLLVALGAASCGTDRPTPTEPLASTLALASAIRDGGHLRRNPHFFFLPPIAPAPESSGVFDGTQRPTVEICVWSGTGCGTNVERYTMGSGSQAIRVDVESELYIVNWHTGDLLRNFPLAPHEHYRIRVFVGTRLLGYADVQVVDSATDALATGCTRSRTPP